MIRGVSWRSFVADACRSTFTGQAPKGIPRDSVGRYARHLGGAKSWVETGLRHKSVDEEGRARLDRVDDVLGMLHARWSELDRLASSLPPTLVHGDLQPKNILVTVVEDAITLVPIDWETCSWGSPSPDLAGLSYKAAAVPDRLELYCRQSSKDDAGCAEVQQAALAGRVLNLIAAMDWVGHHSVLHG